MGSRGPLPKPAEQRVRRNKESSEWREVENIPFAGPEIPDGDWSRWARSWWDRVSTMPHCSLWSSSDWLFAEATLRVAQRFGESEKDFAGELRQREKMLGLTEEDRLRLKIRYVQGSPILDAVVTDLNAYREL